MIKSKWGVKIKRVEDLARSFRHCPLSSPYKPRLSRPGQPASVWRLFPRQSAAFAFAQSCKEEVHVFALEKEDAKMGKRIYLVTSYAELWHYYKTYRHSLMHCYEVIPEGAVCKLYFDLEFHKPSNQGLNGREMVHSLIQYVCKKLGDIHEVKCSSRDVLNLDSSTEDKFSRHLIFLLPNAVFRDNVHVGRFVQNILEPVLNLHQKHRSNPWTGSGEDPVGTSECPDASSNPFTSAENTQQSDGGLLGCPPQAKRCRHAGDAEELDFLWVKNKRGEDQLFVDLGVYTKNRNFRLYKSSKAGQNKAFTEAEDNLFVPKPNAQISAEERVFLASLVSNVGFTGQNVLTWDVPETKDPKRLAPPLIPLSSSCISDSTGRHQPSPYCEVDDYVLSLLNKDGARGSIRRWNYFIAEQLLVYDVLGYRWCGNVGRFHKSNNIMILVDLKEEVWYQKCHDPECRRENYRSPSHPLPREICVSHLMKEDKDDLEYLMDDVGNIEASQRRAAWPEDGSDDQACLEALEEVERGMFPDGPPSKAPQNVPEEVSDTILLETLSEYESFD